VNEDSKGPSEIKRPAARALGEVTALQERRLLVLEPCTLEFVLRLSKDVGPYIDADIAASRKVVDDWQAAPQRATTDIHETVVRSQSTPAKKFDLKSTLFTPVLWRTHQVMPDEGSAVSQALEPNPKSQRPFFGSFH
jgi:hypothetical protein